MNINKKEKETYDASKRSSIRARIARHNKRGKTQPSKCMTSHKRLTLYSSGTRTARAIAAIDGESTRGEAAGATGEKENAADETPCGDCKNGEGGSIPVQWAGAEGGENIDGQRRDE
jgi:hypothetical protein